MVEGHRHAWMTRTDPLIHAIAQATAIARVATSSTAPAVLATVVGLVDGAMVGVVGLKDGRADVGWDEGADVGWDEGADVVG